MKKLLFFVSCMAFIWNSKAQENNPYDQVGIDCVKSLLIVKNDFDAGKIKDFSQEAINEYSHKLPLKLEVDLDLVTKVISGVKNVENHEKLINESPLPKISKEIFLTILTNPDKFDAKKLQEYLVTKTEEVKKSEITDSDKEITLSLMAITYRALDDTGQSICGTITGPNGSGPLSCAGAGVIAGGLIGAWCCGPVGAVVGAVVGGIIGSLS